MDEKLKKAILSTIICNSLVWYDYALYGSLITIIGQLFFPQSSHLINLIEAFGVFAVGFIMRPVGAMIFGHFGDTRSRKYALLFSIISMTIPMLLIALLPTYQAIGITAPILLIAVRIIQGLALGGEAGNAAFLIEYSPPHCRGFVCSFEVLSAVIGSIASIIAISICKIIIPQDAFYVWGWRIPFILGIIFGIIGSTLRYFTDESPAYEKSKKSQSGSSYPIKEVITNYKKKFFIAIGIDSVEEATLYVFLIYFYFLTNDQLIGNIYIEISHFVSMIILAILTIYSAIISDRYGRKKVMLTTFIALFFLAYPMLWLLTQNNVTSVIIGQLILVSLTAASLGPVSAAALELFPISYRYTGFAVSRNISAALFGGMAPSICIFLVHITGYKTSVSFYLMFVALIGIISFLFVKDRYNQPIH